jgi:hypothetical protein
MIWSYKLEFYIKLGWKGLPAPNTLTYWDCLKVKEKMKFCEYSPWNCIHNTSFFSQLINGPNK